MHTAKHVTSRRAAASLHECASVAVLTASDLHLAVILPTNAHALAAFQAVLRVQLKFCSPISQYYF